MTARALTLDTTTPSRRRAPATGATNLLRALVTAWRRRLKTQAASRNAIYIGL